ncbi:MAG: hypothetical protein HOW73_12545 [Polyangiaceae bacterium]|nr:hypothetical protein [Polyangiaceae bacterium]
MKDAEVAHHLRSFGCLDHDWQRFLDREPALDCEQVRERLSAKNLHRHVRADFRIFPGVVHLDEAWMR